MKKYYAFGDAYKKDYVPHQRETEEVEKILTAQDASVFLTKVFQWVFEFLVALPKSYILLKEDYPSLTTLVADHGFDYDELKITEDVEVQLMQKLAQGDYQVLALVLYNIPGLFFDLEVLKNIKAAYPNILIL